LFQQSLLDRVPSGESQAEHLQEQQRKLLHFCDDALATSIRMEHAAITQRISNLQAGLETWKDFLKRVLLLTATFEDQVKHIESVYREIQTAVTEPDVLPLSHTGMQNRLENLKVSPATHINTSLGVALAHFSENGLLLSCVMQHYDSALKCIASLLHYETVRDESQKTFFSQVASSNNV